MATNNTPNVQQLMGKGGCLKKIIVIAAVLFVAYYLMKSCGGGLLNMGNDTTQESTTTSSSNNNTITMPDLTPNSTTSSTSTTSTTNSGDYSWIVGTWDCEMGASGTVVMNFEGDGTKGRCSELQPDGTFRYGSYQVNGDALSYKLTGESFSTIITIESGHKLNAGDGFYYRKRY